MFEFYAKNTRKRLRRNSRWINATSCSDNLVRGEVVAQEAEKQGLDKTRRHLFPAAAVAAADPRAGRCEQYLKDKKATDAERQAEYDSQVALMPKTQYHARHILVTSQEGAQKVLDELKKGAKFEDVAKKESIDSSKEQGGDLGWFSPSSMVKPFADAWPGSRR